MVAIAGSGLLADLGSTLQSFVNVFVGIYVLLIFVWVLLSWIQLPYSRTWAAVQEFISDVVRPYLRLFRFIPPVGPFDLLVAAGIANSLIGALL
jgi:uncharacterized protein YggT (Ycf19 family)